MAPALSLGQLLGKPACPTAGLQTFSLGGDRNVLQPQIDTDDFVRCNGFFRFHLDRQAQPPLPERILGKAATLPFDPFKAFFLEHPKALAGKAQALAFTLETGCLKGYPPERALRPTADPPAQLQAPGGLAFLGVVGANRLNRIGADLVKVRTRTGRQAAQVKARQPLALG